MGVRPGAHHILTPGRTGDTRGRRPHPTRSKESVMKATDHLEVPSATEGLKMFILFHFNWFTFICENIYLFAVLGKRPQT